MPSPVPTMSIETVAVCNFRCVMCPTLGMKAKDMGYMSDETFARVLDAVSGATFIDMTGWGEPLLDEKIFERIKAVRARGVKCAITSNGSLFNEKNRAKLFDCGMEALNISIDSSNKEVFEDIRELGDWSVVSENISAIAAERKRRGLTNPRLRSTFVLMRSNAHTVCDWVQFMAGIGFDEVCIKPADVLWSAEVLAMCLPLDESQHYERLAQETARRAGIQLIAWNLDGVFPKADCLVKVYDTTCHIDWRGNVSPCCNLGHSVDRTISHNGVAKTFNVESLVFGNVNQNTLTEIWNSAPYVEFRETFKRGHVPEECHGCALVHPHVVSPKYLALAH